MDATGFKKFLLPWITMGLTVLGKYIVPPLAALAGIQQAEANSWWLGTVTVLAGIIVGGVTSWLTKKKIIQVAAAVTDKKIAEYDAAPEEPKP